LSEGLKLFWCGIILYDWIDEHPERSSSSTFLNSILKEKIMPGKKYQLISMTALILFLSVPALANTGIVQKVLSGDLVQIGDTFVARLTGIKSPTRDETLGDKIYDFTRKELEGKTVKLFTWTTDNTAAGIVHDENGYPFVEIEYWRGGEFLSFNEVLLRKGYARVDPDYLPEHLRHYFDLEEEAREKRLGIWEKGPSISSAMESQSKGMNGE
jgi:endonuclease YncB( thermonuclease family)